MFDLTQHATPFVEPGVLVPVEIIDQRIGRSPAGLFGSFDRSVRAREQRIACSIVDAGEFLADVGVILLPFPVDRDRRPYNPGRRSLVRAARPDLRGFPQRADAVGRERPIRGLAGDTPTGSQHVAGDCQLMGGCANIASGQQNARALRARRWQSSPALRTKKSIRINMAASSCSPPGIARERRMPRIRGIILPAQYGRTIVQRTNFGGIVMKFGFLDTYHPKKFV